MSIKVRNTTRYLLTEQLKMTGGRYSLYSSYSEYYHYYLQLLRVIFGSILHLVILLA